MIPESDERPHRVKKDFLVAVHISAYAYGTAKRKK
jgi:hypothetical protein